MNSAVRTLVPATVIASYRRFKRFRAQRRLRHMTTEDIFTDIYLNNKWGGVAGTFSSGSGTRDRPTVAAYTAMVAETAASEHFTGLAFVDLGCGDFSVGATLLPFCSSYVGADIVAPLVRQNQDRHGDATTRFVHLNIVADVLPDGDVCFVRQVFQHLSNQQIGAALEKLRRYRWVFITEHYPTDNSAIVPNRDKPTGGDVRAYDNSGVYLSESPFRIPTTALRLVLEVPGVGLGANKDPGVIRTYLYKPSPLAA